MVATATARSRVPELAHAHRHLIVGEDTSPDVAKDIVEGDSGDEVHHRGVCIDHTLVRDLDHPFVEEIVCHQEGAPQAMNVVGLVTGEEGVDLDREAIQCAQAVHAHGPPRDPVRDQGRIHLIRDIVAGVVRGHLVEEGGASVTSGIVGPGLLRDLISWFAQNIVYVTHGRMHAPEYIS